MKNTQKQTNEKQAHKAPELPRVILQLNPKTGTVDVASNDDLDLATVRGFLEEACDNIKQINRGRWNQEQILIDKASRAERKRRQKWNQKEKAKLHKGIKNQ